MMEKCGRMCRCYTNGTAVFQSARRAPQGQHPAVRDWSRSSIQPSFAPSSRYSATPGADSMDDPWVINPRRLSRGQRLADRVVGNRPRRRCCRSGLPGTACRLSVLPYSSALNPSLTVPTERDVPIIVDLVPWGGRASGWLPLVPARTPKRTRRQFPRASLRSSKSHL